MSKYIVYVGVENFTREQRTARVEEVKVEFKDYFDVNDKVVYIKRYNNNEVDVYTLPL